MQGKGSFFSLAEVRAKFSCCKGRCELEAGECEFGAGTKKSGTFAAKLQL
jgi:hypothetical protein